MYDFTTLYPGAGRASEKWEGARKAGAAPATVPLTVADMEFRTAPEIIDAVKETAEFGLWGYTYADEGFQNAVLGWMETRHGWQAPRERMVATPGVVPGLSSALRAFTNPGDAILIQPPVYPPLCMQPKINQRKIIENPLRLSGGQYEMDFDDLRAKAKGAAMMILCSPHNPVGRVWSKEELETVLTICAENEVILFADEIHHDIVLPPHKHIAIGTLLREERHLSWLVATSASKTFSLAGLSASSIFLSDENMKTRYQAQMAADSVFFNSTFGAVATRAGYEKGGPWLEAMLETLAGNDALLRQWAAAQPLNPWVAPLQATYLAWVDLRGLGLEPEALMAFLHQKAQFFANNGADYGPGGAGFIRINLACPRSVLEEALERLGNALQNR